MWKILLLSFLSVNATHDIHLTKADVNYDTQSSTIQISISLFLDDLEAALEHRGVNNVNLYSDHEILDADNYVEDYVSDMLHINIDGSEQQMTYLGKEKSDDLTAVWCYFEVEDVESGSVLKITNQIFTELYNDQKQIMVITKDQKRIDHWLMDNAPFTDQISL